MVIFLRNVRPYISEACQEIDLESAVRYYDDRSKVKQYDLEIQALGTSNYNSLIKDEHDSNQVNDISVYQLNGSTRDYYTPYKNEMKQFDIEENVPQEQIYVPFILTQSGLKPLTSIDMSKRYVEL